MKLRMRIDFSEQFTSNEATGSVQQPSSKSIFGSRLQLKMATRFVSYFDKSNRRIASLISTPLCGFLGEANLIKSPAGWTVPFLKPRHEQLASRRTSDQLRFFADCPSETSIVIAVSFDVTVHRSTAK